VIDKVLEAGSWAAHACNLQSIRYIVVREENTPGLVPGNILLAVAGKDAAPPEIPSFAMGESVALDVERANGARERVQILIPVAKNKKHPVVSLDPPSWKRLADGIGYLKIALFPGIVGIDVARDISDMNLEVAFSDLAIIEKRFNRIASSIRGAEGAPGAGRISPRPRTRGSVPPSPGASPEPPIRHFPFRMVGFFTSMWSILLNDT